MKTRVFAKRSRIHAPAETVFAWHARPGAIERLSPPWDPLKVIQKTGGIETGAEVTMQLKAGPIPYTWQARHIAYAQNRMFCDIQIKGPFAKWEHTHLFEQENKTTCFLEDRIRYALPAHPIGTILMDRMVRKKLTRIFTYRHHTIEADIGLYRARPLQPLRILVSGAGGLIGSALIPFLTTGGHSVFSLVRRSPMRPNEIFWSPAASTLDSLKMEGIDAVIHLSGENIGTQRWTKEKKQRILESRETSTGLLAKTFSKMAVPPKVLVCASAIGYYGNRGDSTMTESDGPGSDFISEVCRRWEAAAAPAVEKGVRVVFQRIGIVLTPAGGALARLLPVFQAGLGGKIASGRQYMSWISMDDLLGAVYYALVDPGLSGPVNAVSPGPVTNAEFSKTLARVIGRPAVFHVPRKAVELVFGEMGKETVLASTRVAPCRLNAAGYPFRHPDLETALRHVLGRV